MLHVPINIRQIPSPMVSPIVEQKDFIPKDDTSPIVVESMEQIAQIESPITMSPPIGSPNLQSNIISQPIDASQVSSAKLQEMNTSVDAFHSQSYPMFVTSETTSPDLGSPIVSVSVNSQFRQQDLDDQMERFSETSSIELIIQGGSYEHNSPAAKVPESHTLQFNHYPGSKNFGHVPIDIAKSFTPVMTQGEQKNQDGGDIYSDYIQDPYNLTLQFDGSSAVADGVSNDCVPSASTVFQSSSYFSSDANDPTSPGSELFNRP